MISELFSEFPRNCVIHILMSTVILVSFNRRKYLICNQLRQIKHLTKG